MGRTLFLSRKASSRYCLSSRQSGWRYAMKTLWQKFVEWCWADDVKPQIFLCRLCQNPIRKIAAHHLRPNEKASWVHETGFFQCPGSRSEYDLATYDPDIK